MKAILIDAQNRQIRVIEIENGYQNIQKAIGCDCFTVATDLPNSDTIYVDDEGLLKPLDCFFEYEGAHQPFAGNGLILGLNDETGESVDVKSTVEEVKAKIKFLTVFEVQAKFN